MTKNLHTIKAKYDGSNLVVIASSSIFTASVSNEFMPFMVYLTFLSAQDNEDRADGWRELATSKPLVSRMGSFSVLTLWTKESLLGSRLI
jgi:hypothetical protein